MPRFIEVLGVNGAGGRRGRRKEEEWEVLGQEVRENSLTNRPLSLLGCV